MANNRLYLKCNVCGETLFLGKTFWVGSYYWEDYQKENGGEPYPLQDRLNEFYEKHRECAMDWNYDLEYETEKPKEEE